MIGAVLTVGAPAFCPHGGSAVSVAPDARVTIAGQPVLTIAAPLMLSGCRQAAGPNGCITAQFITGAARVRARGLPLAVDHGMAICSPGPGRLTFVAVQARVTTG